MFGFFLVAFVQKREFLSAIIMQIYQIRKLNIETNQSEEPPSGNKKWYDFLRRRKEKSFQEPVVDPIEQLKKNEDHLSDLFKDKMVVDNKDYKQILISMITRQRLAYTTKHILLYVLQCLCFRNISKNKHKKSVKEHFLF